MFVLLEGNKISGTMMLIILEPNAVLPYLLAHVKNFRQIFLLVICD